MFIDNTGLLAGQVWTTLNEHGELDNKQLKKLAKMRTDKELYLAIGWLLREDKIEVVGDTKSFTAQLK